MGYSRAVRVGPWVEVSGTVAIDADGNVVGPGDVHAQTAHILSTIGAALAAAGASLADVVRTRIYLTDVTTWPEAARAHAAVFGDVRPACTGLGVRALVAPEFLVEIEASAIVAGESEGRKNAPAAPDKQ